MKRSTVVTIGACVAVASSIALGPLGATVLARSAKHAGGVRVDIRVEGMRSTLLAETSLEVHAARIDPDGKPADTCEGTTAAAALQEATRGHWVAGAYYSGLGYSVQGILGESHAFTSPYFWSFWLDDKTSSVGICSAKLRAGEHLLFFAQCSKQSLTECPEGVFEPPVLDLTGPKSVRAGQSVSLNVISLANASGKSSPGAGVTLSAGSLTAKTNDAGQAKLRFAKPGRYEIVATAPGAIRDELAVRVHR
jgi:adhesin HecA-like repeat protein